MKKSNLFFIFLFVTLQSSFSQDTTRSIVPRSNNQGSIGTQYKQWADGWFETLHVNGQEVPTMAWTPAARVVTELNTSVLTTDYLIWMDSETAGGSQTLNLPNMIGVDSMTIVVRHLGNDYPTKVTRIHGSTTNIYQIFGDGGSVAIDWLGAKTNWYWRQSY